MEGTVCSLPPWLSLDHSQLQTHETLSRFHLAPRGQRSTSDVPPALGTGRMALLQQGQSIAAPQCLRELLRKPKPQDCLCLTQLSYQI